MATTNKASYKVRKSGNSDITTLPLSVQEALNIKTGDAVRYIIKDNRVEIIKDVPTNDVENIISETIEQYDELLSKLVDL
ncbi:addiction module antitoxin [Tetragenococcus halophilus]|uniref:AbrB/MazE/SpoVT family DNA-binding domain-containing protein n=1 Tax=Tetragenococcus halophilus TaxID=51669 RepID=UPI001F3C37CD|nr:addiction module antitoxin [Tetragenococcus halophilus]MCF1685916.1 addiction module antitoxin [Tetragenococcus halophilus]